jgi:hypothetical protein
MGKPVERCKPKAAQVTDAHFGMIGFGILHT